MAANGKNLNLYELLHVSRGAPEEIIRASYRTLMQRMHHHPDLGGDPQLAALINEAYAVLTDDGRRQAYDRQLDAESRLVEAAAEHGSEPMHDPLLGCWFCHTPHDFGIRIAVEDMCSVCASPLFTAEKHRLEPDGQRSVQRIRKRQAIRFFTHWPQAEGCDGRMEDISPNGMRFSTRHELSSGQVIKIVGESLQAVARVSHCNQKPGGWRRKNAAGVSFLTLRISSPVGGFVSRKV